MSNPDLEVWNKAVLDSIQALWGAISTNFRQITLSREEGTWVLTVVLEVEDPVDRDELDDLAFEFAALQAGPSKMRVDAIVSTEPLKAPAWPTRLLFRRRESVGGANTS